MEKLLKKLNKIEYISLTRIDTQNTLVLYRFRSKTGNINEYEVQNMILPTQSKELQKLKDTLRTSSFYKLPVELGFPVDKREWINTKYVYAKYNKSVLTLYCNGEYEKIIDLDIRADLAEKICTYNRELAEYIYVVTKN